MKVFPLLGVFAATVVVLAVAWAICLRPDRQSLLPVGVGVLIAFVVQAFSWNWLCHFPESHATFLRLGFPLSATLIALPLGLIVSGFFVDSLYPEPRQVDLGWAAAMSFSTIGLPALIIGLVLFFKCYTVWSKNG
jgi:hypothetical protein